MRKLQIWIQGYNLRVNNTCLRERHYAIPTVGTSSSARVRKAVGKALSQRIMKPGTKWFLIVMNFRVGCWLLSARSALLFYFCFAFYGSDGLALRTVFCFCKLSLQEFESLSTRSSELYLWRAWKQIYYFYGSRAENMSIHTQHTFYRYNKREEREKDRGRWIHAREKGKPN